MKLAFVVQRCGEEVIGGAEAMCLNLAKKLSKYFEIEILTTCALDYISWKNHYPKGTSYIDNICIRRFETEFERNIDEFNNLSEKVFNLSHTFKEEEQWMKMQGPYCPELFKFIDNNKDNYDLFLFFPYLYATTFFGLPQIASKSILVPQAHDEPPLKLSIYDKIFQNTKAIIFQTEEEQELVKNRFDISHVKQILIGQGAEEPLVLPDDFTFNQNLNFPYLLYVGRIDKSKGCDELIDNFLRYKKETSSDIKLVLVGSKIFEFKKNKDIIYLGILDEQEKSYLLRNATAFVMPSRYESFSIATMEAWLAKKPVIVNEESAVLKGHCEKSNAGLYYRNYEEFKQCLNTLFSDSSLRNKMGEQGYSYVKKNYSWDRVIDDYQKFLSDVTRTKKTSQKSIDSKIQDKILTFVIPWYGEDLKTGAENQCKRTAENLLKSGNKVEVFTTCSKEFQSDWTNFYSEGKYNINGIIVRRFPVDKRDVRLFDSINYKLMNKMEITQEEEEDYIKNGINSSKLIQAIKDEKEKRIYIFIPYLHGLTYFGCKACPQNSIMIPCFHDESYAYMKIFKQVFPKVKAMIFNSSPEKDLAQNIYNNLPEHIVAGEGVDSTFKTDPLKFKNKFNVDKFLLYAGRKDATKNLPLLIDYYCKYIEKNGAKFDLVITGPGEINIPTKFQNHIKSLLLSKEDLYNAYSAAFVTCQPSLNESFSLAIMESWLSLTPVLVHENCAVTKDHCLQSNGGLYFSNYEEFEECINYFLENPEKSKIMAQNGKNYVKNNFDWNKITAKYLNFIDDCMDNSSKDS